MHEDASHLGRSGHEEGHEKIVLDMHILMEQFTQRLLVDIAPDAHEGKLEEADHRRRQDIGGDAVFLQIEKNGPVRQVIENPCRLRLPDLPDSRRPPRREGPDRQLGDPGRILLAEKNLQDPEE